MQNDQTLVAQAPLQLLQALTGPARVCRGFFRDDDMNVDGINASLIAGKRYLWVLIVVPAIVALGAHFLLSSQFTAIITFDNAPKSALPMLSSIATSGNGGSSATYASMSVSAKGVSPADATQNLLNAVRPLVENTHKQAEAIAAQMQRQVVALESIAATLESYSAPEAAARASEVLNALSATKAEEEALSRWIVDLANVRPLIVDDTLAAYRASVATVLAFFLSFYFVLWMGAKKLQHEGESVGRTAQVRWL